MTIRSHPASPLPHAIPSNCAPVGSHAPHAGQGGPQEEAASAEQAGYRSATPGA